MPRQQIVTMAKKAGKSAAEAEKVWKNAVTQAKGSKRTGGTVPGKESAFGDKDWGYVMGVFKKMIGLKESAGRYRVYVDGDRVRMIHAGSQVDEGTDLEVDAVRSRIQELLDRDVDTAFDVSGFSGSLEEINQQVFRDWLIFCDQSPSPPSQAIFADALNGER